MEWRTDRSHAKINLALQVMGKRSDGYHELRTVFQSIELHDLVRVELTATPGVDLTVEGADLPTDGRNLAHRAAAALLGRFAPGRGARIHLVKRVPLGGGLGGGSANAATVLRALDALLGAPATPQALWSLARELGADVPFFLLGGTALGTGRGDELLPLAEPPERRFVLALPPVEVPTAAVFAALGPLPPRALAASIQAVAAGWAEPEWLWSGEDLGNDLESPACALFPVIGEVLAVLRAAGARVVRMSGSGASVFAWFPDDAPADLASRLPAGTRLVRSSTLDRAAIARGLTVDGAGGAATDGVA